MTIIILLVLGALMLWAVLATLHSLGADGYGRKELAGRNIHPEDLPRSR
ncbi:MULTISPECIES: hypothetical protein [Cryobacterium]|nr:MULTISPECIES: hypothetical protein [Cryobacterium]